MPMQIQVVAEYKDPERSSDIILVRVPDTIAAIDTFEPFVHTAMVLDGAFNDDELKSVSMTKVP